VAGCHNRPPFSFWINSFMALARGFHEVMIYFR
jgi:4-amino-4-deoxy-L-arabinose transferase-like glycosyltransferase